MSSILSNGWVEDIGTWLIGLIITGAIARVHIRRLHDAIRDSRSPSSEDAP